MAAETKEQILDAAERLIAEKGIDAVSLRSIIAEAGVNLAAVHYHFGSKEALVRKVYERRVAPINSLRLQMLDELERAAAGGPLDLEAVLRALMEPPLRIYCDHDQSRQFMQLCGRIYAEPADFVQSMFDELFRDIVQRFVPAFGRALPDVPEIERAWRIHFSIGTMIHTMLDSDRLKRFTMGMCDASDADAVIDRMVSFCAAGMRAEVRSAETLELAGVAR